MQPDLDACTGMTDGTACETSGSCIDGVCLHHCGDGIRTGAEECDGADLGSNANCTDLGYYDSAPLACSPACTYDVVGDYSAGCTGKCGDGIVNGPELCEDSLGWQDARACLDFGLDAGEMSCAHCGPSFASCREIGLKLKLQDGGSIHGRANDDIWIAEGTYALHFDGTTWMSFPLPQPVAIAFNSIWVESSGHAWVTGTASGTSPGIAFWDGAAWSNVPVFGAVGIANGIWASGAGDAWIVGASGTPASGFTGVIVRAMGASASSVTIPSVGALNAIWGSSASDAWAVGDSGTILHYDGSSWQLAASPTSADLLSIYGSSASDVWAIGLSTAIHYDGAAWTTVTAPGTYQQTVFTDGNHVWIGGNNELFEREAGAWIPITVTNGFGHRGIWGSGAGDVWFSGAGVSHSSGSVWGSWSVTGQITSLWFDGANPWAAANTFPTGALQVFDGNTWSDAGLSGSGRIYSVSGTGDHDVWVVRAIPPPIPATPPYTAAEIDHYNGNTWTASKTFDQSAQPPAAIWASAAGDVWAVGANTGFLHYTSGAWSQVGPSAELGALWGYSPTDVWAGGNKAEIFHYDGQSWTVSRPADTGSTSNVTAIWGSGPNDVYAVGSAIFHYDGTSWTSSHPVSQWYAGVAGTGPNDVFVVGGAIERNILHWDGTAWAPVRSPWADSQFPQSIGVGTNGVYVGLNDGTIVDLVRDAPW